MLKVIGGGFGRTGTHSLGLALEKLGFDPCYNVHEIAKNQAHRGIWNDAIDGKPVDWNVLFAGYQSAVEWPTVAFLPQILPIYPDAKVILTLRDPGSWFESANATIFDTLEISAHNPDPHKRAGSGILRRLILDRVFGGRYREKEYAVKVYQEHIQNVIEIIPTERLLQFHVKDGWAPLCAFLNKPVPDEPFPWLNERAAMLDSAPDWAKKILNNLRN